MDYNGRLNRKHMHRLHEIFMVLTLDFIRHMTISVHDLGSFICLDFAAHILQNFIYSNDQTQNLTFQLQLAECLAYA